MHRRQFLASIMSLPLLLTPWQRCRPCPSYSLLPSSEGISIGGWYFKGGSELDCGTFLTFRAIIADTKAGGTGGLYTFFYDYLVDDKWLADFKESTAIFGCTKVEGGIVPNGIWLPMVVR